MNIFGKFFNAVRLDDDFDDEEFFDDEDLEAMDEEKPKHRFFRKLEDDYDDEDLDEPQAKPVKEKKKTSTKAEMEEKAQPKAASSKITPMRASRRAAGGATMSVSVIKPTSMENASDIADTLLDRSTVVLNLEGLDVELAQRLIDFASGACYYGGGRLQKVSSYIFIITPSNVEVSGDFQDVLSGALDLTGKHSY